MAERLHLLAVWTKQANSPTFGYIGQLWKYLPIHRGFLRAEHAALIGDLNSNRRWDEWDRWWNHSDVVRELDELELASVYHTLRNQQQGSELSPTLFLQRKLAKAYHVDYAFLSRHLLRSARIEVGAAQAWLAHSDHMPLLVHVAL